MQEQEGSHPNGKQLHTQQQQSIENKVHEYTYNNVNSMVLYMNTAIVQLQCSWNLLYVDVVDTLYSNHYSI